MNIYAYVHGDPANASDPSGECQFPGTGGSYFDSSGTLTIWCPPYVWPQSIDPILTNPGGMIENWDSKSWSTHIDPNKGPAHAFDRACRREEKELDGLLEKLELAGKGIQALGALTTVAEAFEEFASAGFATPAVMLEAAGSIGAMKFGDALATTASVTRDALHNSPTGAVGSIVQSVATGVVAEEIGGKIGASAAVKELINGMLGNSVDQAKKFINMGC